MHEYRKGHPSTCKVEIARPLGGARAQGPASGEVVHDRSSSGWRLHGERLGAKATAGRAHGPWPDPLPLYSLLQEGS